MPEVPLDVKLVLRGYRRPDSDPLVLVTPLDLALAGCESLFGYADRGRNTAIVSTCRLAGDGEPRLRERLDKVIAHERGHLAGLRHCETPDCAMRAVQSTRQLDARSASYCERCRTEAPAVLVPARVQLYLPLAPPPQRRGTAAAWLMSLLLCAAFLFALDLAARPVKVKQPPFSWRADGGSGVVLYKREPVLRLAGAGRARDLSQRLNDLYARISPPPLTADAAGVAAGIRAGDTMLVELTPLDSGGGSPLPVALAFAGRVGPLLLAKGTAAEGCPDCHIHRRAEVEDAARKREARR